MGLSSPANPQGDERPLSAKPFEIPKRLVWNAWLRVRANRGAAGVDEESLELFERDLKKNLYRLWNRMSSGSYFPYQSPFIEHAPTQTLIPAVAQTHRRPDP
jgi:hypothetical protein